MSDNSTQVKTKAIFKIKKKFTKKKETPIPNKILDDFKNDIYQLTISTTLTKPGSVKHLLFGEERSRQSISVKCGKLIGESLPKILINSTPHLELEECGCKKLHDSEKKKDFDLIFKDEHDKIVYYRESKGNMDLDTEKLPATISKINELEEQLKIIYPGYKIDVGIYNWSIFDRNDSECGLNQIKICENNSIKVYHFKEFLELLRYKMSKEDFYSYFRKLGKVFD